MKKSIWIVTGVIFFGQMLFAMANNAQGVLLTSYIDAFGLTSVMQGLPNAAANAGIVAAMLLSVPLASRLGKLQLYGLGQGIICLMLIACGAAPSAFLLVAAYLVMGFGFGCVDTTSSAVIADLHQGAGASRYMGLLHAVYGTGGILAPIAMTAALSAGVSWRWVLYGVGLLAGIAAALVLLITRREGKRLPVSVAPPQRLTMADLIAFARQRGNLTLVLSAFFYCAHIACIYLWVSRIIGVGYGNVELGALALSLFWVGTVASRLLVPATGISTVAYLRYGMLLTALVLGVGAWIGGAVPVCIASALSGLIGGASLPMMLTEINVRNRARSMLAITAVLLTTAVSAILCAPMIGFIVGRTGLIAGIYVSAICAALGAATAFALKPYREAAADGEAAS